MSSAQPGFERTNAKRCYENAGARGSTPYDDGLSVRWGPKESLMIELPIRDSGAKKSEQHVFLRISRVKERCRVLGPGLRFLIRTQGCHLACPGCVATDTHDFQGGELVEVSTLAAQILAIPDIEGLTLTGGEPTLQASTLVELIDQVQAERPSMTVLCYTGFTLDSLQRGSPQQRSLLHHIDCLIDGPFLETAQVNPPFRWRGSTNQNVHLLTPRVQHWAAQLNDRGTWLEFSVEGDAFSWDGIPPPGFRETFEATLQHHGVRFEHPAVGDNNGS